MIELGGNIVLEGFDGKDFTELIVVKKMVGQYVRQLTDTVAPVASLHLSLVTTDTKETISGTLEIEGKEVTSEETAHNLYVALDTCLKSLIKQA